jgi:thiamine kinase-like enzyme
MKNKYSKFIYDYNEDVLSRIALMKQLSKVSPIFPKLHFEIEEKTIRQYSEPIKSFKWPEEKTFLEKLWIEFKNEIYNMHKYGYVHGDILRKNILFDGCRLRLIDHELSLVIGKELRVTFPWVAPEDLIQRNVTQKTDLICVEAMELSDLL